MKVEEAKKKHCPYPDSIGGCICIANECMAWRWFDTEIKTDGYCGLAGKEGAEKETPLSQKVKMLEVEKRTLEYVSKKMFDILRGFQFVNSISTYDRMYIQSVLNEWMNRYVDAEAEVKEVS